MENEEVKPKTQTKLSKILTEKGLTQRQLRILIYQKTGQRLGEDRISKIATGKLTNIQTKTAKLIADALDVQVDDVI